MEHLRSQELSPVGLFELFFDEGTINFIVNETNRYAWQKNVHLGLTAQELKCVLGILILSGYISYPRRRMFWETSPDSHHHLVADAIRRDRFELIFSYLHFVDNSELDHSDRFTKVRPPLVRMNRSFQQHAPLDEFYSFGESSCEYFGQSRSRRPSGRSGQLGCQVWCGTTSSGYLVWFEPSQGTLFTRPDGGLDLGTSMVLRFTDVLQERGRLPYHIFIDEVFTSVQLMSILRRKGVKATGTVRDYRTERCPLKDPKELKKMRRGSFDYKVDECEEVIVCRWRDSNVVTICSNAAGIEPVRLSSRPCRCGWGAGPGPPAVPLAAVPGEGGGRGPHGSEHGQVQGAGPGHQVVLQLHGLCPGRCPQQCVAAAPDLLRRRAGGPLGLPQVRGLRVPGEQRRHVVSGKAWPAAGNREPLRHDRALDCAPGQEDPLCPLPLPDQHLLREVSEGRACQVLPRVPHPVMREQREPGVWRRMRCLAIGGLMSHFCWEKETRTHDKSGVFSLHLHISYLFIILYYTYMKYRRVFILVTTNVCKTVFCTVIYFTL